MNIRCTLYGLALVSLFISDFSYGEARLSREKIDGWLEKLGGSNTYDSSKAIDWGILPGPFYTPELGAGLGVAVIGLYRPDNNDHTSQISSLSLNGFASSTGAFGFTFDNYNFFADDQWRFFLSGTLNNVPTYYWGTGYQAGKTDDRKEKYHSQELHLQPRVLYRVADSTYLGAGWNFSSLHAKDPDNGAKKLFAAENDGRSILSSGVSAYFSYDTRDFLPNAHQGHVLDITYTHFSPALGSDRRFNTVDLQYSTYYQLDEKSVLAFDSYGRFTDGQVPWNMLSMLGNSHRMRGYYEGRYRDKNVISTQLEYRHKLDWRHGFVLWAGAGTLSHYAKDIGSENWLPTVGAGYRFEFKPKMNVRLDFGIGKKSNGFYFQVGEAF
ncbi:BamA/TamA family outer membrane protein [Photorhabdus laumondii]|uniref:BamA/TamA family outer membrane protein n=1 Tax=Photorhabdus laumondii TaxID=2218628 RepID=UPI0025AFE622|nr:BamA/TamA family outer membrane protein [Photorhabdus laumondii]